MSIVKDPHFKLSKGQALLVSLLGEETNGLTHVELNNDYGIHGRDAEHYCSKWSASFWALKKRGLAEFDSGSGRYRLTDAGWAFVHGGKPGAAI